MGRNSPRQRPLLVYGLTLVPCTTPIPAIGLVTTHKWAMLFARERADLVLYTHRVCVHTFGGMREGGKAVREDTPHPGIDHKWWLKWAFSIWDEPRGLIIAGHNRAVHRVDSKGSSSVWTGTLCSADFKVGAGGVVGFCGSVSINKWRDQGSSGPSRLWDLLEGVAGFVSLC